MTTDELESLRDGRVKLTRSHVAVLIDTLLEVMELTGTKPNHESPAWQLAWMTRNRTIAARIEAAELPGSQPGSDLGTSSASPLLRSDKNPHPRNTTDAAR